MGLREPSQEDRTIAAYPFAEFPYRLYLLVPEPLTNVLFGKGRPDRPDNRRVQLTSALERRAWFDPEMCRSSETTRRCTMCRVDRITTRLTCLGSSPMRGGKRTQKSGNEPAQSWHGEAVPTG